MYSDELISHPELQPLMKKFNKKFPKIPLEAYMMDLGQSGYTGMGMSVDQVKVIFEKCLRENKYFKVSDMKQKSPGLIPCDWYEGKVAYYKYYK